jgi:hypothetical protein
MKTKLTTPWPSDLRKSRIQVLDAIDSLEWRHHGAGMIQAYINPTLRVHVWHPSLMLPGMVDSGAIHDHRFDLESTLLVGNMVNREYALTRRPENGFDYSVFEVECSGSKKTDDPVKVEDGRGAIVSDVFVAEGMRYAYPKRELHMSVPLKKIVVTLVTKMNQEDVKARLLAPRGTRPVHAWKQEYCAHHTIDSGDRTTCRATRKGMLEIAGMAKHALLGRVE